MGHSPKENSDKTGSDPRWSR